MCSYSDGETIDIPGPPRAMRAPGHTAGSAALLVEGRTILFTGDGLCTKSPLNGGLGPQISRPAWTRTPLRRSGRWTRSPPRDRRLILPGHGGPYRDGVPAAVAGAKAAGRS